MSSIIYLYILVLIVGISIVYMTLKQHHKKPMKAIIRTYPCAGGDCIFLKLLDPSKGESYHIMVDCGALSEDIVTYICNDLGCSIDLLVATHIDWDHIDGIIAMLRDEPRLTDLKINKIIYNCYQHEDKVENKRPPMPKDVSEKTEMMAGMLGAKHGSHIAERSAISLGSAIINRGLKSVWNTTLVNECTKDLPLGGRWGKIRFLSPSEKSLQALYKDFHTKFASVMGQKLPDVPFENIEDTFEMIVGLESKKNWNYRGKKISYDGSLDEDTIIEERDEDSGESLSKANKASLAFEWECNGHRVLFMGDAPSSIVAKNLGDKKIIYDAIKISHHGSEYNTCSDFADIVDTHTYFLTGGSEKDGHSLKALAKLLIKEPKSAFNRELRYNVRTKLIERLESDECKEIREKYNFSLKDETDEQTKPFEFEY